MDENIPTEKQKADRKPWHIALTRKSDQLTHVEGIDGLPSGNTLLLSEQEVVELVRYLLEPQTAMWSENPSPTEPGKYLVVLFVQPGMIDFSKSGHAVNGEAQWSPEYFKRQESHPRRELHAEASHVAVEATSH